MSTGVTGGSTAEQQHRRAEPQGEPLNSEKRKVQQRDPQKECYDVNTTQYAADELELEGGSLVLVETFVRPHPSGGD